MIRKRIKAFTLVELMVVMIIATLLSGIIYVSLQMVYKNSRMYTERRGRLTETRMMMAALRRDFDRSVTWRESGSEVTCMREEHSITYTFNSTSIVRTVGMHRDTAYCTVEETAFYYQAQPVTANHAPVDEMEVTVVLFKERLSFNIYKTMSYEEERLIHKIFQQE
jgi:prepilin-type N-terminal cleavage/methylation domain-containing protein